MYCSPSALRLYFRRRRRRQHDSGRDCGRGSPTGTDLVVLFESICLLKLLLLARLRWAHAWSLSVMDAECVVVVGEWGVKVVGKCRARFWTRSLELLDGIG